MCIFSLTHRQYHTHINWKWVWQRERQTNQSDLNMPKENKQLLRKAPDAFRASYSSFRLYHKKSIIINFSCGGMGGQAISAVFVFVTFSQRFKKQLVSLVLVWVWACFQIVCMCVATCALIACACLCLQPSPALSPVLFSGLELLWKEGQGGLVHMMFINICLAIDSHWCSKKN